MRTFPSQNQDAMFCNDVNFYLDVHLNPFTITEDRDGEISFEYFVEEGDTAREIAWLFNSLDQEMFLKK